MSTTYIPVDLRRQVTDDAGDRCGYATVEALRLNRELAIAARRLWIDAGWHPPAES